VTAPSFAAVKAGAKCTKAGATATAGGKKFTCIKSGTRLVWNKGVTVKAAPKPNLNPVFKPVEPTPTPTPVATPTPIPSPVATPTQTPAATKNITYMPPSVPSEKTEICKIKEVSNSRRGGGFTGSGFPEWNTLTSNMGTVKWALIPIDFSDLPGEKNFRSRVDGQMKLLSDWYSTVSEGKFKVEWVVADKWMTLPGKTSEYVIPRSVNLNNAPNGPKLFRDAMDAADPFFDFTNIQVVNFILPNGQTFIGEGSQGFPWDQAVKDYVSREGRISAYSIPGQYFDLPGKEYWSYWAHEFVHSIGIAHIGSSHESNPFHAYDMSGSQDGPNRELSGWLRFFAGWLSEDRIYCQGVAKLQTTELTLVPLSGTDSGVKVAIIPINEAKAVVIESRRVTKFDCTTPTLRNGVLVYIYDAKLGHGEPFLIPIAPAQRALERDSCGSQNNRTEPTRDLLLHEGDKVTVEGVTVEVLLHGNYDKIRITKVG
jgi:M6 family metalloprotease-like protein